METKNLLKELRLNIERPANDRLKPGWLEGRLTILLLLILAVAGVALVLVNTRLGAYLSDDTYYYIYPARDLVAGKGFNPSYIFAPLFPLALGGFSLFGLDALVAARWLNAILFGVNIFLAGQFARRAGATGPISLLAATLLLLSDVIIEAHGWAMSEALSFTFMLLSLDGVLAFVTTGRRRYWWIAAATAAMATLTRYAAVPLIAAICLELLLYPPGQKIIQRIKESLLWGGLSIAPVVGYWIRNQLTSGHLVRYQRFLFQPFTRDQLNWFLYNWLSLFFPGRFLRGREILAGLAVLVIGAAILCGFGWFYRRRWAEQPDNRLSRAAALLIAFIGMELLMLFLARGLTELDVYNPRYLVPLLIASLILLALLGGQLWRMAGKWMRPAIIVFFSIFLVYYAYRAVDFTRQMTRNGLGYANATWHNSETVPYIRTHPEMVNMVSTGEMGIYFWTGRMPTVLAAFSDPLTLKNYLCENQATLFLMDQMPAEIYGLQQQDIVKVVKLVKTFNDSSMYRCPDGK